MHFLHDVAATNELTFDVDLRDRWPVGVSLDLIPQKLVLQYVDILIFSDSIKLENLHHIVRKSAPWHFTGAFHKKANVVVSNPFVNLLDYVCVFFHFRFSIKVRMSVKIALVREHSHTARWQHELVSKNLGSIVYSGKGESAVHVSRNSDFAAGIEKDTPCASAEHIFCLRE